MLGFFTRFLLNGLLPKFAGVTIKATLEGRFSEGSLQGEPSALTLESRFSVATIEAEEVISLLAERINAPILSGDAFAIAPQSVELSARLASNELVGGFASTAMQGRFGAGLLSQSFSAYTMQGNFSTGLLAGAVE